jgi:hypothetical protein
MLCDTILPKRADSIMPNLKLSKQQIKGVLCRFRIIRYLAHLFERRIEILKPKKPQSCYSRQRDYDGTVIIETDLNEYCISKSNEIM